MLHYEINCSYLTCWFLIDNLSQSIPSLDYSVEFVPFLVIIHVTIKGLTSFYCTHCFWSIITWGLFHLKVCRGEEWKKFWTPSPRNWISREENNLWKSLKWTPSTTYKSRSHWICTFHIILITLFFWISSEKVWRL